MNTLMYIFIGAIVSSEQFLFTDELFENTKQIFLILWDMHISQDRKD